MWLNSEAESALRLGLQALHCDLNEQQIEKISAYLHHLNTWNKIHNLTAIRDEKKQVINHVLDSLSVLPFLSAGKLADIGTGAGIPALILAIADENREIFAVESLAKKSAFLRYVVQDLKLKNVRIIQQRVENWHAEKVDVLITRAMSKALDFYNLTKHLAHENTVWLMMKAQQEESLNLAKINNKFYQIEVPFLEATRHLYQFSFTS